MRIVIQRVKSASVEIDGQTISEIGPGFLLLVGIGHEDDESVLEKAARKICNLRVFEDDDGKMNLDLKQFGGEILAVSQFTLYADTRKGNRPSFTDAAKPEDAERLFNLFVSRLRDKGFSVGTGKFAEIMAVKLINWGPVTITLEF